ncbi:hypothetical protein AT3G24929 [Arabidopsis thaliana]|uniref:Uncharacterized protein n=1 Tax=Arabidopsis thaliana TaxID=3702 RepID=F4J7T7_ARATH|nr:uncharacterized protein AT3G24929 [Arabidopsis thaliana]AEE76961.2 hypothetical protein AT3G24929 [Arabidopsis thaliana]|eukprot:NP_001319637.1 hypothetical protein AT3G24929 [Arabidopsis thaliana]
MASPIALLQQIPMAFNKRYGGGKEWLQLTKRPKSKVFLWRTLRRVFGTKIVVIIHSGESYEIIEIVQLKDMELDEGYILSSHSSLFRRPKGIVEICPRDAYQLTKKQEGIIKSIHMIVRDRGKFIMELYLKKSGKVEKGIKID